MGHFYVGCTSSNHNGEKIILKLTYKLEMALSLVKGVPSNLMRVKPIASSSRFFNTKGFEYDQRNSKGDCILKCDHKYGSCVHYVVNSVFDPRLSPTGNLACLLTMTDGMIGYKYGTHVMTRWSVAEDDNALYLLRDMPAPKFMAGLHKDDVDEVDIPVPQAEFMFGIHDVKESARETNISSLLHLMRGVKREPSEYYYHVMQDAKELAKLSESAGGTQYALCICLHVSYKLQNPQAIRIIMGVGARDAEGWDGRDTGSWDADYPFGGYAVEILLPERLFSIHDVKEDKTSESWNITIPKKKGEMIHTIGGNLLIFQEKKVCKPTLWRPE